jgi:16S rRNA (guanine527-N7)-methyltransferase
MADLEPLALLEQGAEELQIRLPAGATESFSLYLQELKRWNARINLTGLRSDRDIVIRLFLDSLALLPWLGEADSLADLGSGAGFPGLVLKLARPELCLTLVESRSKKAAFLEYMASVLKLRDVAVAVVHLTPALAQEWGPRFAAVVSRAAFSLAELVEFAAPLLAPGGLVLAPKGPHLGAAELDAAEKAALARGLSPWEIREYRVPGLEEPRLAALARKPA